MFLKGILRFVKESLGEYGSGWEWENTSTLAFDQTNVYKTIKNPSTGLDEKVSDDTPIRYSGNGTSLGYCYDDYETTNGEILNSGSFMSYQKSCKSNTGNAGNFYSWPTSTIDGNKASGAGSNSVCPKGWQLSMNTTTSVKNYYYLIDVAYNVSETNDDTRARLSPLSFVRSGRYKNNLPSEQGVYGRYWSSSAVDFYNAHSLRLAIGNLVTINSDLKTGGFAVRCVSR